jgi:hypothetical protein
MTVDVVLFNVPEDAADNLAERILGLVASVSGEASLGFETPVDPSLLPGLGYLESRRDAFPEGGNLFWVRVYEADDPAGRRLLITGEKLSMLLPGVVEIMRAEGVRSHRQAPLGLLPGEEGWSLVGMAFPGWILLFDPEAKTVQKSEYGENVTIMSIPAPPGCPLENLSPTEPTTEAMGILIRHLLPLLTSGNDAENPPDSN